jgi:hypothetical protein
MGPLQSVSIFFGVIAYLYGLTSIQVVNFIQQPLPEGSTTGAGFSGQSGALNMGQRASTGLTTLLVNLTRYVSNIDMD